MGGGGKSGGGAQVTDYRMSVHLGVASTVDAITGVYVNQQTAWEGEQDTQTSIYIDLPNLYGGNTSGGGLQGYIDWLPGGPTQVLPSYLAARLGGTPSTLPAFRGVSSIFFYGTQAQGTNDGFLWTSNNPVIAQNIDLRVRRTPPAPALDQTLARIPAAQNSGYMADTSNPGDTTSTTDTGVGEPEDVSSVRWGDISGASYSGYASGVGGNTTEAATNAAASINASSQFFTATASGNTVIITEKQSGDGWINAVAPVADANYPYRASTVASDDAGTLSYSYFFDITAFGSPQNDSNTGLVDGPSPTTAKLTFEAVPQTGMTFSVGPEIYTFTSYPGDDANPAFMIYDVFTNNDWGMGYPASALDTTAFAAAASTLFGESLGLSVFWDEKSSIEDFVNDILNHIQGVVFLNPSTGLLTLKLIRNDYVVADLPTYGPDQFTMTNYQKRQWAETTNEIVVSWTNPITEQLETVTAQNPGNIAIQGGQIISDSKNYHMVRNEVLAAKLAARDCSLVSAPLDTCEIKMDRSAWATYPGDCIIINYPENGLSGAIMRVGKVQYGTLDKPEVTVSLTRDIFSLTRPSISPAIASLWTDPAATPTDFTSYNLFTVPYYFMNGTELQSSTPNLTYPEVEVAAFAFNSNRDFQSFDLYGEATLSTGAQQWTDFGTKTLVEMVPSPAFVAEAASSLQASIFPATYAAPAVGEFLLIGNGDTNQEIVQVASLSSGVYTLNRGMLDTIPQAWPAGTNMWVISSGLSNTDTANTRSAGEEVTYKLLSNTSQGQLALASATAHEVTLTARPWLPLRPANVQVNGVGFGPVAIGSATNITITWATRNRILEDGQALPWTAAAVSPEYYQETIVTVFDQNNNQVFQQTGLWTEDTLVLQASNFARYTSITIEVGSRLDGDLVSLNAYAIQVTGLPGNTSAALPPTPAAPSVPPSPVAAPSSANWSVSGSSVASSSGSSVPAIVVTGAPDSLLDAYLVVQYAPHGTGSWSTSPLVGMNGNAVTVDITGVQAETSYDVRLAYQVNYGTSGYILSSWLVPSASPVTTGAAVAGSIVGQGGLATASIRGNWAAGTAYNQNDIVYFGGASYSCLTAHTSSVGNEPPSANWQVFAAAGVNPVVGYLTNAAVTLPANSAGIVTSYAAATGTFKVFSGTTDVTTSSAFAAGAQTNCTATVNATTGAYSVTAMSAATGSFTMSATYGGVTVTQVFTLATAPTGATGSTGAAGTNGANGATGPGGPVVLIASTNGDAFTFTDGVASPSSQTLNFVANRQNTSGSITWSSSPSVTLGQSGTGNVNAALTLANFGANSQVAITATDSTTGAADTITVVKLTASTAAAGATVGANWASNLTGTPANLSALTGTEAIQNAYLPSGSNHIVNSEFTQVSGTYPIGFNGAWNGNSSVITGATDSVIATVGGAKAIQRVATFSSSPSGYVFDCLLVNESTTYAIPVTPGQTLMASCAVAAQNTAGTAYLCIAWLDSNGSYVQENDGGTVSCNINGATTDIASWPRTQWSAVVPADGTFGTPVRYAVITTRFNAGTATTQTAWSARPMLSVVPTGQTVYPAYQIGPVSRLADQTAANTANNTNNVGTITAGSVASTINSGGGVATNQVTTTSIVAGGVTGTVGVTGSASLSGSGTYVAASATLVTTGAPVFISPSMTMNYYLGNTSCTATAQILVDGSVAYSVAMPNTCPPGYTFSFPFTAALSAGSHTVKIQLVAVQSGAGPVTGPITGSVFMLETKR